MITFKNRQLETVAQAHYFGANGLIVNDDDEFEKDIATGVSTYTFTIDKTDASISNVEVGNYVFAQDGDLVRMFEIIDIDEDTQSKLFYCEDSALDLLEDVGPLKVKESHNLAYYFNQFANDTGWIIGVNEASNLTRKIEFESTESVIKRLRKVAKKFDCEIDCTVELTSAGDIVSRKINFYKHIGKDNKVRLEFGEHVSEVRKKVSIRNLATTVYGVGTDDLTLKGYTFKEGNIILDSEGYLTDSDAVERWKRPGYTQGGTIVKRYESESKTQDRLLQETLRKLKQWTTPEVTYEVDIHDVPEDVRVGDTITVVDLDYMPALILEARIVKMTRSLVNNNVGKAIVTNVVEEPDNIDSRIADLKRLVSETAKDLSETAKELENANNKLTDFENNVNSNFSDTNNVLNTIEQNLLDKLNNTNNKLTDLEQNITHEIGDTNNVLSTIEQNLLDKLNSTNNKLNNIESDFGKRLETTKNELGQDLTVLENDLGKRITVVKDNLGNTVKVIEGGLNDKISDAKQKFDKQISETKNNFGQTINVLENDLGSKITIVKNEFGKTVNVLQGDLTSKIDVVNSNLLGTNDKLDATNNALDSAKNEFDSKLENANSNLNNLESNVNNSISNTNNKLDNLESNVNNSISNTNNKLDNLESDVTNNIELTQQQLDRINEQSRQLNEELKSKASLEVIRNFELKILENLQSQREISEESKQDLQNLANRVVGIQNNLQDMSAKWTFIDRYVTMAEEGFVIGNADSGSKILINEEKIVMQSNGQDVMTIADGMLTINNGVFLTSLQIGYYIESVYESDKFCNTIRYVGPDWRR